MSTPGSPRHGTPCIALVAFTGVDELDLVGAWEVLAKAHLRGGEPRTDPPVVVGPQPGVAVTCSNGLALVPHAGYGALERAVAVVVPGGPGAPSAAAHPQLAAALRRRWAQGTPFYTVCTGVLLLGALGLVDGRTAAVHAERREALAAVGATPARGLTVDGRLHSVGGVPDDAVKAVRLAFHLLEERYPHTVEAVARRLEVRAPLTAVRGE